MEAKRERHRRFWSPLTPGEGAYIAVQSPISDAVDISGRFTPAVNKDNLLDTSVCVAKAEADHANTFWGGDAIHSHFINFGPGVQAAFFGAPYVITDNSVWFDTAPPIQSWTPMPDLTMNRQHELYRAIDAHTRALCDASRGRYVVSYTDIGGQYDILYSLRGEAMLLDMFDCPEILVAAQDNLDAAFIDYFNELTDIIRPANLGFTNWMPIVHDVPWYPIQCDMSVLLSPKQVERFVLPSLERVSAAVGCTIYHLDGPEEIKFLDMFLSLTGVHAIQWVPLPTYTPPGWAHQVQNFADALSLDLYRRIKKAGKKIMLYGVPAWQLQGIFDAVGADGMFIYTYTDTRKEADELVDAARKKWMR